MSEWAAKRFWTSTSVDALPGGFEVLLDGRRVKTPAKANLILPTEDMAQAIASEWDAQEDRIDPNTMPVTRSANAAIDKLGLQRDEVIDHLAAYGDSDLTCYRAEGPDALVARQSETWNPLLDWAAATFDARLAPVVGVMHRPQDAAALARLKREVARLDNFQLTAFHDLVSLSGSLVIGLAVTHGAQPVQALWTASLVDETWQEEQWGVDEEARELTLRKREAFMHAHRFFHLSDS